MLLELCIFITNHKNHIMFKSDLFILLICPQLSVLCMYEETDKCGRKMRKDYRSAGCKMQQTV